MVVGGSPAFLTSLDRLRALHGLLQFVVTLLGCAVAVYSTTSEHWTVGLEHYSPYLAACVVSTIRAFVASQLQSRGANLTDQIKDSTEKLREALRTEDRIMARLLVDIDNANMHGWISRGRMCADSVIPTGQSGNQKVAGIAALNGCLYCAPDTHGAVLILPLLTMLVESRGFPREGPAGGVASLPWAAVFVVPLMPQTSC